MIALLASVCAASQRLNISVSCAIRCRRSASLRSSFKITGAENPRRIDGVTPATTPSGPALKRFVTAALSTSSTCSSARTLSLPASSPALSPAGPTRLIAALLPSGVRKPRRTGIGNGSRGVFAAVSGVSWAKLSSIQPSASFTWRVTLSDGVPAWRYQPSKALRSTSFASASAATKSSQVTAAPSCRSKYKSIPRRNPSRPR